MNDIKWIYCLIAAIYLILGIISILNRLIVKEELKAHKGDTLTIRGFKKDFFSTIAWICTIGMLIINGLCLYGNKPLNYESIITTFLVIGLAIVSGMVKIIIVDKSKIIIGGYIFNKGEIKEYRVKEKKAYNKYNVVFSEDLNGYESVMLYISQDKGILFNTYINEFIEQ